MWIEVHGRNHGSIYASDLTSECHDVELKQSLVLTDSESDERTKGPLKRMNLNYAFGSMNCSINNCCVLDNMELAISEAYGVGAG